MLFLRLSFEALEDKRNGAELMSSAGTWSNFNRGVQPDLLPRAAQELR